MNSIYEQLNKINDNESLSEKYNVKNSRELKNLKESADTVKIPAPWNKYLEVDDYTPEEGEYNVGDHIGEYTLVTYLAPKSAYEDKFDGWPMLFKDSSNNYVVGETSHDRVYPWDIDDYALTEAVKVDPIVNKIASIIDNNGYTNRSMTSTQSSITMENKSGEKTTFIVRVKQVPQYILEEEMVGTILETTDKNYFIEHSAEMIINNKG